MLAVLRATSGPLRGAVFRLLQEQVTIGRHPSNLLCIGDVSVSRFHCIIEARDDRYRVKDLNSHNGTLVNGEPVTESLLKFGDLLGVGDTAFEFIESASITPDLPIPVSDRETIASVRIDSAAPGSSVATRKSLVEYGRDSSLLAAVARTAELLDSAQGSEDLQSQIWPAICDCLLADRVAAFIIREHEWAAFGWSGSDGACPASFARREIVDQVFKQGKSVLASDAGTPSGPAAKPRISEGPRSLLAVPLIVRARTAGVIYLERYAPAPPFTSDDAELARVLSRYIAIALDYSQKLEYLEIENRRMHDDVQLRHAIIGQSRPMQEVYRRIAKIAPTDATVLIRGETGTGKELAARAIHDNSPRADRMFQAVNCSLLRGDFLETELFGHEKGAFTGAVSQKKGKLEIADQGTVFLDEVAELPEGPQAMLLRVLQENTFSRLGGTREIRVDIRVIAATNKDLEEAVRTHKFRDDLYYRLNVVSVCMPPLRERRDDIPLLAQYFLRRASERNNRLLTSISAGAMVYLQAYQWPGNVRELENAIEHAVVFGGTAEVRPEDLPEAVVAKASQSAVPAFNYQTAVRNAKRKIVLDVLQQANGDHSEAARLLNIHPTNLYRLIRDLDAKPRTRSSHSG